ncbi:ash family protein [Actinobacillus equuli]|uniref:ash family protein n=1 Tax=Actinobacillus equuli TaxID=718 RepID=UPI002442ED7B|nr:ash family protein [Actinobacillus equuli]WGE57669.1 ash family protein [Actinobacillus equuli subsp. equuli]WGE79422.1 ash family protein [Actinobacillus equuli subsp. equuli]
MNILQYITTNSDTIDNNQQGYLDMVHSVLLAEFAKNEENSTACKKNCFTSLANKVYAILAFAKSEAERGNSNLYLLANITSTPKNRAIFVCGLNTPKERLNMACSSMVAFSGQRLIVGCFPVEAVFHPAKRYRPTPWKVLAIVPQYLLLELSAMIYLFKAVSRLDLRNTSKPISSFPCYTVRIKANSLEQAKAKVCPFFAVKEVVYA